jgi:hypothetical protein
VRINLGFKAWSTLSAMLLSIAVMSGCNDESANTPATPPATPAPAVKPGPPAGKMEPTTPPPSTPKADEKK